MEKRIAGVVAKKVSLISLILGGLGCAVSAQAMVFTQPSQDPQAQWYGSVGLEIYAVNLPTYRLPITFGDWLATVPPTLPPANVDKGFNAADTTAGNTTLMPTFSVGYHLKPGSNILPACFDQEAIEVTYQQFNRATKDTTYYTGATGVDAGAGYGIIWSINNPDNPIYGGGAVRIENSFIHASAHYHDASLFVKGRIKNLPRNINSTVKLGIVATALDQYYAYDINSTTQGNTHDPIYSLGDDSLRSRYVGVGIGDVIDFQIAPAFSVFVDANVQALAAHANLTANQIPDQLADPAGVYADYRDNVRVEDSDNAYTYRAIVSGGLNFYPKFTKPTNPIKISIFGGIDEWGYVPAEVTVTAFGGTSPHIEGHSMRNFFAGASVSMAIA